MNAALYVRVSSEDQADNFSISAQINLLNDYCQRNNITIYKIYEDEGISAKYTDESKRPQFQQMLNDAEKKYFNIILVHKYDRFARNVELSQRVKRQIRKAGVNVVSITEPVEDSPIGFITEGLMELLAEYYIRNLSVETKKGHLERARKGLHNGSVPYGYRIDHNHPAQMVIDPEQAKIIQYIYDCYVYNGHGLSKIAKSLNSSGILGAIGGKWCPKRINSILSNHKYIGNIKLGDNVFSGIHDPIINIDQWETAQQMLKLQAQRNTYRGDNFSSHYLLGLARCGVCGRAVIMRTSNGKKYYVCSGNKRAYDKICNNTMTFRDSFLEEQCWEELKRIYNGVEINANFVKKENAILFTDERKQKLEKKIELLTDLYLDQQIKKDDYLKRKSDLEKELKELKVVIQPEEKRKKVFRYTWDEIESSEDASEIRAKLKLDIDCILVYKDRYKIYAFD